MYNKHPFNLPMYIIIVCISIRMYLHSQFLFISNFTCTARLYVLYQNKNTYVTDLDTTENLSQRALIIIYHMVQKIYMN